MFYIIKKILEVSLDLAPTRWVDVEQRKAALSQSHPAQPCYSDGITMNDDSKNVSSLCCDNRSIPPNTIAMLEI